MAKSAILAVRIVGDAADAINAFNQAEGAAGQFQSALDSASLVAGAALTGLVAFGGVAVTAASDAEQAMGGVQSVFGDAADEILAFADDAAQAVGLSTQQYNELATVFGAQLSNMGVAGDELIGTTDDLIGMGADLAATFGGTTADAVSAISALLRGERDPIERYGVSLKQADINARLAAEGLDHLDGEARRQAETMVTLQLLTEQTAGAQGQFARESDTAAGQVQRMQAELANTTAELGTQLLPLLSQGALLLSQFAQWVSENQGLVTGLAITIGVISAAIIGLNIAMRAYAAAQGIAAAATAIWSAVTKGASVTANIAAAAQWLWNAAVAASPVVLIVLAIIAAIALVVAAIWWLVENWDEVVAWISDAWTAVTAWISTAWDAVVNWVVAAWNSAVQFVLDYIARIRESWDAVVAFIRGIWDTVTGWISDQWQSAVDLVIGAWEAVQDAVDRVGEFIGGIIDGIISGIQTMIGWIGDAVNGFLNLIGLGGEASNQSAPTPAAAPQAVLPAHATMPTDVPIYAGMIAAYNVIRTAQAATAATSTPARSLATAVAGAGGAAPTVVYNITINGAVDKNGTAREIRKLLDRDRQVRGGR